MMSLLMGLLVSPLLPGVADQTEAVRANLHQVKAQLMQLDAQQAQLEPASHPTTEGARMTPAPLPRLTGTLLAPMFTDDPRQAPSAAEAVLTTQPQLRGVMKVGVARMAIVSHSGQDHVLAEGSYLQNAYRVREVGANHVVLLPLQDKRGAITLKLDDDNQPKR